MSWREWAPWMTPRTYGGLFIRMFIAFGLLIGNAVVQLTTTWQWWFAGPVTVAEVWLGVLIVRGFSGNRPHSRGYGEGHPGSGAEPVSEMIRKRGTS